MKIESIIMAAGKGTRMHSSFPKVLHKLAGQPILEYVINAARQIKSSHTYIVYGYGGQQVKDRFSKHAISWIHQSEQKGTGHAVAQALPEVNDESIVLVLNGDVPLIRPSTLSALTEIADKGRLALLTISLADPGALGRIIRSCDKSISGIKEFKDANADEVKINEVYTGVMAVKGKLLRQWLSRIDNNNAQQEYYLTDVVKLAVEDGVGIEAILAETELETLGVNSKNELGQLERMYQHKQASELMQQGLTLMDPSRFDLRGSLNFGKDCQLDINVIIEGDCQLGDNVKIGANCVLKNVQIGDNSIIEPFSLVEDSIIANNCLVGPYARLRPGSELKQGSKIGNFVEVKNSVIGENSKANHLSYVGDSQVGRNVNMGAGMITCNYDGANKHKTIIGDNVHVGSDCQLVAPVTINADATIGAGTTVYKDAPGGQLSVNKKEQIVLTGWQRPKKSK